MKRKSRNLLVSAIALVIAGGAFLFLRSGAEEIEPVAAEPSVEMAVLSDLPMGDLRSVRVENPEGGYQLFSADGVRWEVADVPEFYRADIPGVLSAVRNMSGIRGQEVETGADEARLGEFGLDSPETIVSLRDRAGITTIVEFGVESPSGAGRFARVAGSDTVALVPSRIALAARATKDRFRLMNLPTVNLEALSGFSYRSGNTVFVAEPYSMIDPYVRQVGRLEIVSPYRGRYGADDFALNRLLTETSPLPTRVVGWLDEADPEDPALGLAGDDVDYINLVDLEGGALLLQVGTADGEGNRYARLGDREGPVFLLREADVAVLEARPFDLLSKFMFLAGIIDVASIKVEQGSNTWIMNREEQGDPEDSKDDRFFIGGLPVDHSDYSSTYQKFIGLMWEGEITERRPLEFPDVRVTVSHDAPGVENIVIRFWPYDDTYYQATVGDNPIEFLVGRYQVELFIEDLAALSEYAS